jgi:predicted DNA-binding WGR domain protein
LSYHIFIHREKGPGEFWNIYLQGPERDSKSWRCSIHYGKAEARDRLTPSSGHWKEIAFRTRDKALEAYHKMIRQKLAKGYVELHERETAYSTPPAPVPKPIQKTVKKTAKRK